MNRRDFLTATAVLSIGSGAAFGASSARAHAGGSTRRLRFAPHTGMFRNLAGDDPVDQIQFAADQGFDGFEEVVLSHRAPREQERIGAALDRCGLEPGPIPGLIELSRPSFASGRSDLRQETLRALGRSLACTARMNATTITVIPGRRDNRLAPDRQRAHAVSLLRECADLCAAANVTMLLEPVAAGFASTALVRTFADAVDLCRSVGDSHCRVLGDIYVLAMSDRGATSRFVPQARDTTDVLDELDRGWDQVGSIAWGDAPGRKEPGTGRLDFAAVRQFLQQRGDAGLIRMDHGNALPGDEGERAVLDAYRALV